MKICKHNILSLFLITSLFSLLLFSNNFFLKSNSYIYKNDLPNRINPLQIKNIYAIKIGDINNSEKITDIKNNEKSITNSSIIEENTTEKNNYEQEDSKDTVELANPKIQNTQSSTSNTNSSFNFVAAGDWACTSKTKNTVENIIDQDPELVLALGDLSYDSSAKCWLKIIKPIAEKTKIVIGNHEVESSKKLKDYMKAFNLEKQYYSFNYQNVHFLALSTETAYDEGSKQYKFAEKDLEQYSNDESIDWIVVIYHKNVYSSGGGLPDEKDFRENYHPLFDKYNVDLALQGHHHAYERFYPITFNDNNDNKPIVSAQDKVKDSNVFQNPEGTIFLTVGTGGAESMPVSKGKSFSAAREGGKFGIINMSVERDGEDKNILVGTFLDNKKKHKVIDEFKIIKIKEENK